MLGRIKNHGNRVFLPSGIWLEKGAEAKVPAWEAKLMAQTNPDIELIELTKRKK